jgi:hypothetical protein
MKRFIIIECNDQMSTMFVAVHEGESVCMTPLLAESVLEQCESAVKAVPVDNILGCPLTKDELLAVLDNYVFHGDWPGDRDWQGNRVHGPILVPEEQSNA